MNILEQKSSATNPMDDHDRRSHNWKIHLLLFRQKKKIFKFLYWFWYEKYVLFHKNDGKILYVKLTSKSKSKSTWEYSILLI